MSLTERAFDFLVCNLSRHDLDLKIQKLYESVYKFHQIARELEMKLEHGYMTDEQYHEAMFLNTRDTESKTKELACISHALSKIGRPMPPSPFSGEEGRRRCFNEECDRIARYSKDMNSQIPANPYLIADQPY